MIECGFFNSVNKDRLYTADMMTRPYELLISNGVFATPQGKPSSQLQVVANGGMSVMVKPGRGIFKDKWFINDAELPLTVSASEVTLSRIDSIIVKIDASESVRAGTIEIKKGTPASSPAAPTMTRTEDVYEYRLADILVKPQVTTIAQANITDQRGSADCPWVTSLVQQVDTSTLLKQWQDAYQTFYNASDEEFETWLANTDTAFDTWFNTTDAEFDAWFAQLKQTVATQTLIRTFESYYITQVQNETVIPIQITQFNNELDILQVHINGLKLVENVDYTIESVPANQITLVKPLEQGQQVNFTVYKSVDGSEAETILTQVEELQNVLDASKITNDTGGTKLNLTSGDLLASFKTLGKGFHTVLAGNTVTNVPVAGQYYRCFGHITDVPYGWIIAVSGDGKAYINFASSATAWTGWKELTNSNQITSENGGVKLSVTSSQNVLTVFAAQPIGAYTIYAQYGATGVPVVGAYRMFGHLTAAGYGWILAMKADGSTYTNYLDNNVWQGWKALFEATPTALYTSESGAFPNADVEITPSKTLVECQHGWEVVFCGYDDSTNTAKDSYVQTVHIPKRSHKGTAWNGERMTYALAYGLNTDTGVVSMCAKTFQIYPTKIVSGASNPVGLSRNMVIKAIYEY